MHVSSGSVKELPKPAARAYPISMSTRHNASPLSMRSDVNSNENSLFDASHHLHASSWERAGYSFFMISAFFGLVSCWNWGELSQFSSPSFPAGNVISLPYIIAI